MLAYRRVIRGLALCLLASCAADAPTTPAGDPVDPFAQSPADPARTAALVARAKALVRPGTVMQTEPRLGVPTFLWARDPATTLRSKWLTAGVAHPEIAASRAALADYAPLYGLADADVAGAVVSQVHDLGTGPILVKFRSQIGGVEVFREELNVVMNRQLEPVALSGYLTGAAAPAARAGAMAFNLPVHRGAITAINLQAKTQLDAAQLVPAGARDGYEAFTLAPAAGVALTAPVRAKQVYFHTPGGLEAAYYVEVFARTGVSPDALSVDGSPVATSEAYAYVVSAATGQILFRRNLTVDAVRSAPELADDPDPGFTYRVWADPVTKIPFDTPAGNAVHPKVVALPDGFQAPFVAPSDVTLRSAPFSRNDPWLAPGATETIGNNVDAYLNLFDPDGVDPAAPPSDPPTGDFRAQITGPGQFLHTHTPDGNGALAEGRQGTVQQLFYNINFLHDWYYDAGFDEAAGNGQNDNYGRGGIPGDRLEGQAQDFSGFNNANMTTPADGANPVMRMYVFTSPANRLGITSQGLNGNAGAGVSMSGPQTMDITAQILLARFKSINDPTDPCGVTNAATLDGKIALFDFDTTATTGCGLGDLIFSLTATTNCQGLVMIWTRSAPNNPTRNANATVSLIGFVPEFTKPLLTISFNNGTAIKNQLTANRVVTGRMFRAPDRDGALDQQIVFHEFFHYVSNRLVGDGSGLGTNHAGGMGEGWSDFSSMLLTVRPDDTATPSNATWNGVYALATYATSGVPVTGQNQGYYFGIRRYPYSTDMTKNPLTFKHIAEGVPLPAAATVPVAFGANGVGNSEVHNTGEVWTTMLWECYAALLRDTLGPTPRLSFQDAQDRMKRYIIGGLKVTPIFPTFLEARDAILAVALASDPVDYVELVAAFAKRGAGPRAIAPDRFTFDNIGVVEDFAVKPDVVFDSATLSETAASCADGVLDHGESGVLTIALRNIGTTALSATTATITSPSSDVAFPDGATVAFPAMALGAKSTVSVRVAYAASVTGIQQLNFQISYVDPQVTGGPQTKQVGFRVNTDEQAQASATDTVEALTGAATVGFNDAFPNLFPWKRVEVNPLQHVWHADDPGAGSDQFLISPPLTIGAAGSLTVAFDHSWSFEGDGVDNFDGGVVEVSINGGAFADLDARPYNGTLIVYDGNVNPLQGRRAFVAASAGTLHATMTKAIPAGSTVRVRFRLAADEAGGGPGWNVDNVAYTGVVETPFAPVVADAGCSSDLAIAITDGVTTVHVGDTVSYTITASNLGTANVVGALVSDAFPAELTGCSWTCTATPGATCSSGAGNLADQVSLPPGAIATYAATCTVSRTTLSTALTSTATIAAPDRVVDVDAANNTASDTDTLLRIPAHLFAGKTVAGSFAEGGTVTYTIELGNTGPGTQFDNAGDELTDILPTGLTLVSASASAGTAVANIAAHTATWNGEVPAGGSVTITIVATITAPAGTLVSNQATFLFDTDGDGVNETLGTTDSLLCPVPSSPDRRSAPGPGPAAAPSRRRVR